MELIKHEFLDTDKIRFRMGFRKNIEKSKLAALFLKRISILTLK